MKKCRAQSSAGRKMQVKKNQRLIHVSKHMAFLLFFCIHLFQLILFFCCTRRDYPPILHLQNHLLTFLDNLSDLEENWINTNAYKIFYSKKKKKKKESRFFLNNFHATVFVVICRLIHVTQQKAYLPDWLSRGKKYNSEIVLLRICSQIFPCTIW